MCFVRKQLEGTSSLIGYRYMHLKARATDLVVDKETIKLAMKAMDPEMGFVRATHKLKGQNTYAMDQMKYGTWTATTS